MNPRGILTPRTWHLALRLAIFAVLAQLALGIASAQHQARMLAAGPGAWEAICTPDGVEYISLDALLGEAPAGEDTTRLSGGMHCAVCAAALLDPAPAQAHGLAAAPTAAADRLVPPRTLAHPAATPGLLPPPRAPPALS